MERSVWATAAFAMTALLSPFLATLSAQPGSDSADWARHELAVLEGWWAGEIDGTLGPAEGLRRYRLILEDRFLFMQHDRDPQPEFAQDDGAYEEWAVFSFDADRNAVVVREFLVEGLVNRYVCDIAHNPTRLTCESEATENGAGSTLRLRYEFDDRDRFTETFEIAGADGDVQVRIDGRWRRTSGPG